MEPYRPNEPFIKMKLNGSLLDRMVEAGIPLTRALQYFRDNPEGSALETLSRVADEVVPFKYNIQNNGSATDFLKEAVMLGMPIKAPMQRGLIRVPERKININDEIKLLETYDDFNRAADRLQESHPETAEYLRNAARSPDPIEYNQAAILNTRDANAGDIVFGNTRDYGAITNEIKYPFDELYDEARIGQTTDPDLFRVTMSRGAGRGEGPRKRLAEWKEAYVRHGGQPEEFNNAIAKYYSDAIFKPKPYTIAERIKRSGEPYNFTINELKNLPVSNDLMKQVIKENIWSGSGTEEMFNRIRAVNPEAANRIADLYRQYTDLLADQSIPAAQKVEQLNLIDNTLNSEFEALGIE